MRKTQKIGGFAVEAVPYVRGNRTEWCAWLIDLPHVREFASSPDVARKALAERWEKMVAAFRVAGEPMPRPIRRRGNKRILDVLQALSKRRVTPIF